MDWQFKVGIGAAIAAVFIPYVFKDMPTALSWSGLTFGILFIVWGFIPGHAKMPVAPSVAIIILLSGLIGSAKWWQDASLAAPSTGKAVVTETQYDTLFRASLVISNLNESWDGSSVAAEIYFINETSRTFIIQGIYVSQVMYHRDTLLGDQTDYQKLAFDAVKSSSMVLDYSTHSEFFKNADGSFIRKSTAQHIAVDGSHQEKTSLIVSAKETKKFTADFQTLKPSRDLNISVYYPTFKIIQPDGNVDWIVCEGVELSIIFDKAALSAGVGRRMGNGQLTYVLFPLDVSNSKCRHMPY